MGTRRRWRGWLALAGLTCCLVQAQIPAQAAIPVQPEFKLKAKLLMRIADYAEWPQGSSVQDKAKPFTIGVLGSSLLTAYLEEELKELRTLKGKPIQVLKLANLAQVERCQVLFIGESEFDALEGLLQRLRGKPIFTVSDTEGFATRGVMLNVMIQQSRPVIELNLTSLRTAGITVESRVQARAILVGR